MSKFKAGDRVRDASGHFARVYGKRGVVGTVIGHECGFCKVDWEGHEGDRVNWSDDQLELLVSNGPVREVTRKEIVPGVYGHIVVNKPDGGSVFIRTHIDDRGRYYTADGLRTAIATLTDIADALAQSNGEAQ